MNVFHKERIIGEYLDVLLDGLSNGRKGGNIVRRQMEPLPLRTEIRKARMEDALDAIRIFGDVLVYEVHLCPVACLQLLYPFFDRPPGDPYLV